MTQESSVRIPLIGRDGSVRCYAVVDAADADWLGQWTWRAMVSGGRRYPGRYGIRAYRAPRVEGKKTHVFMHRVIMGLPPGREPEVDHINRDSLDNRRVNLRAVSHAQNHQNKTSYTGATSRFRGVCWNKERRKWEATGRLNNKNAHLGYFRSEDEAAVVALRWRAEHMPYAIDE